MMIIWLWTLSFFVIFFQILHTCYKNKIKVLIFPRDIVILVLRKK